MKIEQKPRLLFLLWERKDATCPPYTGTHFIYVSFLFPVIHYEEKAAQDWKELSSKCPLYLLYDVDPQPLSSFPAPRLYNEPQNTWLLMGKVQEGAGLPWGWLCPSLAIPHCHQRQTGARRTGLMSGGRWSSFALTSRAPAASLTAPHPPL